MKYALVLGAGGFIGSHMVKRLRAEGYWVRGVDLKFPEFAEHQANEFVLGDLRDITFVKRVIQFKGDRGNFYNSVPAQYLQGFDEIYQFAADMGGAGYLFTGNFDADIMHNSALINLNLLDCLREQIVETGTNKTRVFYSSSACVYPEYNQEDPQNPNCKEDTVYPAIPDSEYGWEKLFSERMYFAYHRNYNIDIRVVRYHGIFGPEGTWDGGKEKAPAAICRKVAKLPPEGGKVEVWGDGQQTRSFLYIDECIEATRRFMQSDFLGPINIGSEEMITINQLVDLAAEVEGKQVTKKHIPGPLGVRGRNSNNDLLREKLQWDYSLPVKEGVKKTYNWIKNQL